MRLLLSFGAVTREHVSTLGVPSKTIPSTMRTIGVTQAIRRCRFA